MGEYDDIINLPHHESKKHLRLSKEKRAGQFAPFSALTGYSDEVKEVERITQDRIELDDDEKENINNTIQMIRNNIKKNIKVTVTYFIPDTYKSGGEYVTKKGIVKRIDDYNKKIILDDKTEIKMNDIVEILV